MSSDKTIDTLFESDFEQLKKISLRFRKLMLQTKISSIVKVIIVPMFSG